MSILNDLLELYKDIPISPYKSYRGDKGAGYYLNKNGKRIGGVSIGSQEVEILARITQLSDAQFAFVVGVAFGLNTACMALANPKTEIYAIDNYTEHNDGSPHYVETIARQVLRRFSNVHLCIGTSPQDTSRCLQRLPLGAKLTIAFIDGKHTDKAATDDLIGLRPYISNQSIIIWHDIDKTPNAFFNMFDSVLFDRRFQLPTWGCMGVYLNSSSYPLINDYLSSY